MTGAIPDLLAKRAALGPDRVAFEDVATGRTLTFAELDARAARAASLLHARGLREGDRAAILCRNRIEFFEILFGCAKLGALLVPLNWRMPPAELDALVADADPSLIFYGAEDAEAAANLGSAIPAIGLDEDYEALLTAAPAVRLRTSWPAGATWYLLYTSGTTGRPKGVVYTFRMALSNYVSLSAAIGIRPEDRTASFLPLFHTAGINLHALPTLIAGGCVLILPAFDADALVGLLRERRLDTFFAVPTIYQSLLDHPGFASASLDHVRHWGCGGAPLPDNVARRCRDVGIRICNGMGMTETGPTAFLMDPADAWEREGSVGRPQLLCSARIVDALGRDVPEGNIGDLIFSGPGITPGYWRNEEATRAAFTPDGWLRSGDLARRDADGFFYIAGRRKEMYISGGENVYPAEVEKVLCTHPAIVDVAVLGRPDPRWGEVGQAFVQVAPQTPPPREDELRSFCRQRLAPYKVPVSFAFVADFPRTSAGKIQKHLLA